MIDAIKPLVPKSLWNRTCFVEMTLEHTPYYQAFKKPMEAILIEKKEWHREQVKKKHCDQCIYLPQNREEYGAEYNGVNMGKINYIQMALHKYNNPFKSDWFLWFDFGGWRFLNNEQIEKPSLINLPPYKGLMNQLNNPTRLTIGMESPNNIMK